ncbi:MAG TPA: low molecular weight protein arginine phosphatase [Gemmatimonadales bacterium]|jgi:protein-tyrosine-phosphatase|nr:low molecular weight protein arginine phosphatase [Gemmatimonadales bacterium]
MRILLVCTGNTCRSPLAEALLKRELAERGLDGVEVSSAGTGAWDGAPASEGAYLVGLEHGLDLSAHRARLVTRELVQAADLILTMARHHRARVEQLGGGGKTYLLGEYAGKRDAEAEVRDPFGGDLDGYRETLEDLLGVTGAVADRLARERSGDRR